jgi:long-subunit acyl-CoA synthetase (AMP-forming)
MGALSIGGIVTPANNAYSASELAFQLKDSDAKAIITQASCLKTVLEAGKTAGIPINRIVLIGDERHSGILHLSDLIMSVEKDKPPKRSPQDAKSLAFLVYSSGTTGLPKGVMLTHRNIVANTLMMTAAGDSVGPTDTVTGMLPFAHIAGNFSPFQVVSQFINSGALRTGSANNARNISRRKGGRHASLRPRSFLPSCPNAQSNLIPGRSSDRLTLDKITNRRQVRPQQSQNALLRRGSSD